MVRKINVDNRLKNFFGDKRRNVMTINKSQSQNNRTMNASIVTDCT